MIQSIIQNPSKKDLTVDELIVLKKEKNRIRQNEWRKANADKVKKSKKDSYIANKAKNLDYAKEYRVKNNIALKEKNKQYCDINKEKRNKRDTERKLNNPLFKLSKNINCLIRSSLRNAGFTKKSRTFQILGCSFEEFKKHIESKFETWMTWDNYGNPKDGILELNKTWDFDHKTPISSVKTEQEIIKLNHYSNYQPLCSFTNRFIKRNKNK